MCFQTKKQRQAKERSRAEVKKLAAAAASGSPEGRRKPEFRPKPR